MAGSAYPVPAPKAPSKPPVEKVPVKTPMPGGNGK